MVEWLPVFIGILLEAPLVVAVWSLIRRIKEFPTKSTISISILIILVGIWILGGVGLVTFSSSISNEDRATAMHIGFCCVVIAELIFSSLYASTGLSRCTVRLAQATSMILTFLLGVLVTAFVVGWDDAVRVLGSREDLRASYHPFIAGIMLVSNSMFAALLYRYYVDFQNLPEAFASQQDRRLNGLCLIFFLIAAVVSSGGAAVTSTGVRIPAYFPAAIAIAGRIPTSIAFLLFSIHITRSPLFVLHTKGSTCRLLDEGLIGWVLATMRDVGPSTICDNELFNEKNGISETDMLTFCAASLTAAGMGESFRDGAFILPFPYHDELIAVCVSFFHFDPEMTDPRHADKTLCLFALVVPSALLSNVGAISRAHDVLVQHQERTSSIVELSEKETITRLADAILNTIF